MLAYAFKGLKHKCYDRIDCESFEHTEDLLASILLRGISQQIKQGLHRDYLQQEDNLSTIRGKIQLTKTIRLRMAHNLQINCLFDELTIDNLFNRILKSSIWVLLKSNKLKQEIKFSLRKIFFSLAKISVIDLDTVCWSNIHIGRQTQTYELLINICRLIYLRSLHTEQKGKYKLSQWEDESSLDLLYQRFLLNYFNECYPELKPASKQIPWATTQECLVNSHLPSMRSDVILTSNHHALIIDAKFYKTTLQSHYDKKTFHSNNLYQIFTYVQNYQAHITDKTVSGMLLYARTQESVIPNDEIQLHGNTFLIQTIDLNCEFNLIRKQLNNIAESIKSSR